MKTTNEQIGREETNERGRQWQTSFQGSQKHVEKDLGDQGVTSEKPMGSKWKTHMEEAESQVENKSKSAGTQMEDQENKSGVQDTCNTS